MVEGLFEVVKRIYGITAKERKDVETWHPDVRFFDLFDANGELRGSFTSICTPAKTNAAAPGWTTVSAACARPTARCKTGRLPDLQLQPPAGRPAGAVHP